MLDGPTSFETPIPQPLRELPQLPEHVLSVLAGVEPELTALEQKPRFPTREETHCFREGLVQNAQVLLAHKAEIFGLLEMVTGQPQSEAMMDSLLLAAISTDFGKLGPDRLNSGEVPMNMVARVYREFRWDESHVAWLAQPDNFHQIEDHLRGLSAEQIDLLQSKNKGRTVIPFEAAVEVMKQVALQRNSNEQRAEIEQMFSLTETDEAMLMRFGLSKDMPLSQVFTALHCRSNADLLPKITIPQPDRDYACGHHFPSGITLLPEGVVERHHLDGQLGADEAFTNYVANTALLAVTDRLQGFVQRSNVSPREAMSRTTDGVLNDIKDNFRGHPQLTEIQRIYAEVLLFALEHRLAEYYAAS